jgi:pimeloyl-ACP methyl ester carboxylesterase
MKVYFISGLAADDRVFKHIVLPVNYEPVHLKWIVPSKHETLPQYAVRLSKDINRDEPFMLFGLSMGGMIAAEIARIYRPQKTIIVSSITGASHLPAYFRWAGKLRLHKLMHPSLYKSAALIKRLFTNESSADKKLLRKIIQESDPIFIRWAIDAILHWNENHQIDCIHIHGSNDLLLPVKYTSPTHIIKGGGHMMILDRADDINKILKDVFV